MFRPHKIKWSDYRSKIVPDAKKQPIRHSQMERLLLAAKWPLCSLIIKLITLGESHSPPAYSVLSMLSLHFRELIISGHIW